VLPVLLNAALGCSACVLVQHALLVSSPCLHAATLASGSWWLLLRWVCAVAVLRCQLSVVSSISGVTHTPTNQKR
jgi:hypothetical protein